jgi:hypothetical protein
VNCDISGEVGSNCDQKVQMIQSTDLSKQIIVDNNQLLSDEAKLNDI